MECGAPAPPLRLRHWWGSVRRTKFKTHQTGHEAAQLIGDIAEGKRNYNEPASSAERT
jgi:hypothetical protein